MPLLQEDWAGFVRNAPRFGNGGGCAAKLSPPTLRSSQKALDPWHQGVRDTVRAWLLLFSGSCCVSVTLQFPRPGCSSREGVAHPPWCSSFSRAVPVVPLCCLLVNEPELSRAHRRGTGFLAGCFPDRNSLAFLAPHAGSVA